MIKKILAISFSDAKNSHDPLRIFKKSYARWKKKGLQHMLIKLDQEYFVRYNQTYSIYDKVKQYQRWIEKNEQNIYQTSSLSYTPLISVITPVYNTNPKLLQASIESILSQTYINWELCIADDASTNPETIKTLKAYENHSRIKILYRSTNGHISEASNSALSLAEGEYVVFLDHDDMLAPHALYEMVKKLNENPTLKLIYSDEDKIDENGKRFNPHFKSGWNPDMFFSQNYICHLVLLKKEVIDHIEGFRKGYEGAQDYDLLLRSLQYIKEKEIDRIEKILYHWRAIKGSTAYGSGEKEYAHDAGLRALQDHFSKKDPGIKVEDGLLPNTYKVNYPLDISINDDTLVSLLIPTRDGYDILYKCIESIREKTHYSNYEIIVLDNETTCPKTLEYFKKIKQYDNVRIVEYHKPFNYSAINNFGLNYAKGEIVGLLNNDVEIISEGWLNEMVQHALRPEIGAVGAMLYYDNNTIQHAGVILGIGGVAGHSHKYFKKNANGYFSRLKIIQNFSAVTGACLLVRKSLYERVGGLDAENLKVAFNDIDFCLKLQKLGYRNLWTPYVELYHHESQSRGAEDTNEKQKRYGREMAYMKKKWKKYIENDRYYNSHLSKISEDFSLHKY